MFKSSPKSNRCGFFSATSTEKCNKPQNQLLKGNVLLKMQRILYNNKHKVSNIKKLFVEYSNTLFN